MLCLMAKQLSFTPGNFDDMNPIESGDQLYSDVQTNHDPFFTDDQDFLAMMDIAPGLYRL